MRFVFMAGLLGALLFCSAGQANEPREVPAVGLSAVLGERVMLEVNGQQHMLAAGETSPEGVELVRFNHDRATVRYADDQFEVRLGESPVRANYMVPEAGQQVTIYRDGQGMYLTPGTVNGQLVNFMVDTGATSVAMDAGTAEALGIDYVNQSQGRQVAVSTANGRARAWRVVLDRVRVGAIEEHYVEAIVIESAPMRHILLGMSFLRRLDVSQQQGVMVLSED
ncbi:MAG: retropepsin-like aspartic protease family protein [Pseudomonadota bacterium]